MGKICELQIRMDGKYAIVCRKEKSSCMTNKSDSIGNQWPKSEVNLQ